MSLINWLLIRGAEAALWLWDLLVAFFSWLFGLFQALLNPVLSPLLALLNPIATFLADLVYAAVGLLPITWGLLIISVIVGLVMLIAFRHLSNQAAIGRAKDDIKANLLALKLFKDDLRVMFRCQARILWGILRLQRYILAPVLWMTLPMLLVLAQMGIRYQWRPLRPGEQSLLIVRLEENASPSPTISLEPNPGVIAEVGPVPGGKALVWRIRGAAPGRHVLRLQVNDQTVEKEIVVGKNGPLQRVSALRPSARWTDQLLHPVEPRLAAPLAVESIELTYPLRDSILHGAHYWVLTFFLVSMIAALVMAPWFRIRF